MSARMGKSEPSHSMHWVGSVALKRASPRNAVQDRGGRPSHCIVVLQRAASWNGTWSDSELSERSLGIKGVAMDVCKGD